MKKSTVTIAIASLALSVVVSACDEHESNTVSPAAGAEQRQDRSEAEQHESSANDQSNPLPQEGKTASKKIERTKVENTTPSTLKEDQSGRVSGKATLEEKNRRESQAKPRSGTMPEKKPRREVGVAPDPSTLTPQQQETWRVVQHIRKNYDYEEIRRAGKEYRRQVDEMREAERRGEPGSRLGARVAGDPESSDAADAEPR